MRSMFRVLGIYNFANIPKKQQITTILLCTFASYILYAGQAKPGQQAGLGFKAKIREDLQS